MHPVLFEIPGLGWPVFSYGVMLGLSLILGWYFTLYLAERDGYPRQIMGTGYVYSIVAAMVGARLLYIVANPDQIDGMRDLVNIRQGGLVAYGGFLGGVVASWAFCRAKRVKLLPWADAAVPSLALGLFVTRIGCFLYGCDYGRRVTESDPEWLRSLGVQFPNWAVRFPDFARHAGGIGCCQQDLSGAPAFLHHSTAYGLDPSAAASFPVVPAQLFDSLNGLIALGVVLAVRRFRTFYGQVFLAFTIYYGLTRFFIETVRDDTQRGVFGPAFLGPLGGFEGRLTTSQIIAFLTVVAAIVGWVYLRRAARRDPEGAKDIGEGARVEPHKPGKGTKARRKGARRKSKRS